MYKLLSVVIALLMGITLTFVVGSIAKGAPPGIIESDSSAVFVVQPASHATSTTAHDDFDNAIAIGSLPFTHATSTSGATAAGDDPTTCTNNGSVWYRFTSASNFLIEANTFGSGYDTVLSVYTGSRGALTQVPGACNDDFGGLQSRVVFEVTAGTTYHFLVGFCCGFGRDGGGNLVFTAREFIPPPPVSNFFFFPSDPSIFDTIQFINFSNDPGGVGIQASEWDFGDGEGSTIFHPTHRYAADGDYSVVLGVTTFDNRTATSTQLVLVRTHDVAITKFAVPRAASSGQTRQVRVGVNSNRMPEDVTIRLFKSSPQGFQLVGTLTQFVPVRSANRTTRFGFSYTFTNEDASIGKVTFKAIATIVGARDALPADNESISPPVKVNR